MPTGARWRDHPSCPPSTTGARASDRRTIGERRSLWGSGTRCGSRGVRYRRTGPSGTRMRSVAHQAHRCVQARPSRRSNEASPCRSVRVTHVRREFPRELRERVQKPRSAEAAEALSGASDAAWSALLRKGSRGTTAWAPGQGETRAEIGGGRIRERRFSGSGCASCRGPLRLQRGPPRGPWKPAMGHRVEVRSGSRGGCRCMRAPGPVGPGSASCRGPARFLVCSGTACGWGAAALAACSAAGMRRRPIRHARKVRLLLLREVGRADGAASFGTTALADRPGDRVERSGCGRRFDGDRTPRAAPGTRSARVRTLMSANSGVFALCERGRGSGWLARRRSGGESAVNPGR